MNFTQRAMLYLSRKKGKTISLFLLVFVVAVFLISCFRILNASTKLSGDIRSSLGAAFYLRAGTKVSMGEDGEVEIMENHIHITQKVIDEIMQAGDIKYCNPINYGFAKSSAIQFIPGDKYTEESNMGKVTALRFSALAPDFADGTAVLAEGKHITGKDQGKILISEPLAKANQLSVGDTLTLTHARFGEADGAYIDEIPEKTAFARVEVAGIYQLCGSQAPGKPTAGMAENEIYASLDVLVKLHESEAGIYTGEVDFYITDPEDLEDIVRNVQRLPSIDWDTHFLRTNDFQYSKVAAPLASLNDVVRMLLVLVSAAGTAFLILLLTMRMRGRMREAGILLAAGISKGQIMAGFMMEVLSVSAAALIASYLLSFGMTGLLGHGLAGGLLPGLPAGEGTQPGLLAGEGVQPLFPGEGAQLHLLTEEALAAGADGSISMEGYLKLGTAKTVLLYLAQTVVITASALVSSIGLTRLKPKEILSKMS